MSKKVKLGEIASFQTGPFGTQFKASEYSTMGTPVINVKNIGYGNLILNNLEYVPDTVCSRLSNHLLKEGDIVFGRKGSVDRHCYIKKENEHWMQGSDCIRVRLSNEVNARYISYYLMLDRVKKQINNASVGSTMASINTDILKTVEIVLPCLEKQNLIVDLLSKIDENIENNNKINIELEAMVKTIYDYWFLQFDYPDDNGKPYKSSGGKMVWNEELKKEIPERWSAGTLSRYIAKDKGGDWGKEVEEGNYIKRVICLRGADFPSITGNSELVALVRYILEKNMCKILENGDLIIEISGGSPTQSTGRICYINNNLLERFDTDIVTSNFCKAISLNEPNYMYWFYIQWLKIYDNNVLFKYEGKTTGIKNLLFDMFVNDYKIAVPPNKLIIQYNNIVCAMFEKIQKNQKESQELASLRDFLLPLLMNGQVGFKQ